MVSFQFKEFTLNQSLKMFEEGQVNSLNLQELYGILPHHFLLSQLKLVEEEERWVINLKSIDHILNTPF